MRASMSIRSVFGSSRLSRWTVSDDGRCLLSLCGRRVQARNEMLKKLKFGSSVGNLRRLEFSTAAPVRSRSTTAICSHDGDGPMRVSGRTGKETMPVGAGKDRVYLNQEIWRQSTSRQFWTVSPLHMGRRSAKIATRKGAQNRKKAKLYGKIGKQIAKLVKEGGPSPTANAALAVILQTAKQLDVPKDIIDRNIKKASDKNQADFVDMTYEVYGLGGVGIVLEVLTDNNNRAAATIRDVVKKGGGKMADPGSVLFNFKRAGVIYVRKGQISSDHLLLAAMDAGADDVVEPQEDEEDDEEEPTFLKVLTSVEQFFSVSQKLKDADIQIDEENSGLELFPLAMVEPDDEAADMNRAIIEKLLDLDDVDAAYSNQR